MYETFFIETGSGIYHYLYVALIAEFTFAVLIHIIMNCYWSWLVVLQITRIFTRGQVGDSEFVNFEQNKKERVKNPKHVELAEIPEFE